MLSLLAVIFLILTLQNITGGFFAWFALLPFFYLLDKTSTAREAFVESWVIGFIVYSFSAFWLTQVTVVGFFLLASLLGFYFAIFGWLYKRWRLQENSYGILIVSALWVCIEYLRSIGPMAFPWFLLSYSQQSHLKLIQVMAVGGSFVLSFLIVWINRSAYEMIFYRQNSLKLRFCWVLIGALFLMASYFYGHQRLNQAVSYHAHTSHFNVALIQANIDQDEKWDPVQADFILRRYERLTLEMKKDEPKLIVWPETAIPGDLKMSRRIQQRIKALAKKTKAYLCLGGNDDQISSKGIITNAAFFINPEGRLIDQYDKTHLVPYGEYVPLRKWIPWLGTLTLGEIDFSPGNVFKVFEIENEKFSMVICFEDILAGHVRRFVKAGARWIVNLTNDAWFGFSKAAEEHLNLARFSAIANGVSMVRATNTGISAVISPYGEVMGKIQDISDHAIEVEGAETFSVPTQKIDTFYQKWGDLFSQICICVVTGFGFFYILKNLKKKERASC